MEKNKLDSIQDAISAIKNGEVIIVVDDDNRENEGDFIMAADKCTPKAMAEFIRYSSGVICIGMEGKRMDELELPPMVVNLSLIHISEPTRPY